MCNSFFNFNSCGKCKRHILDKGICKLLNINQITELCSYLAWRPETAVSNNNLTILSSTLIYCNRTVKFNENATMNIPNQKICSELLLNWCKLNKDQEGRLAYIAIYDTALSIQKIRIIQNLRTQTLKLQKYVNQLTICNGICREVTINKEVHNCEFTLDKLMRYMGCDGSTLLHIMNTIVFTLTESKYKNYAINTKKVQVVCNGGLRINDAYKLSSDPLRDTKEFCNELIQQWCEKYIDNIEKVDRMQTINLLCQESSSMMELYAVIGGVFSDL